MLTSYKVKFPSQHHVPTFSSENEDIKPAMILANYPEKTDFKKLCFVLN